MRRGARVVESGGLENRCTRKGTVGSNPTLSARSILDSRFWILRFLSLTTRIENLESKIRRGAGVAELAALEMLCTGNCTVGSNPTLSAIAEVRDQRSEVRGQKRRSEVRRQKSVRAKLVLTSDF